MVAEESALVLVLPNDTIDTIIAKVRNTGAAQVQLLVPEGASALQSSGGVDQLRRSAERNQIGVLVITSDENTLNAVRAGQIEAIGVEGTQVMVPGDLPGDNGGVRGLDDVESPGFAQVSPAAPYHPAAPTEPITDAELMASLNDLSGIPERKAYDDDLSDDYDPFAAELDAWSDASAAYRHDDREMQDDDFDPFAAELDAWSSASANHAETETSRPGHPVAETSHPHPRVRPEDIELSDDEIRRANRGYTAPSRRTTRQTRRAEGPGAFAAEPEYQPARKRPWFLRVLPLLLLLLLVIIAALLLFDNPFGGNRAADGPLASLPSLGQSTVVVTLPPPGTMERPFTDQPVPIVPPGANATDTAIQAAPLSADAQFSATGQVTSETQAPSGTASGTVTLLNTNTQPLELPLGTEFVAVNAEGQEVRFAIDAPVTIPPATTSDQGAQIITTRGQANVGVTALAPGSASNVDANTISQIVIPGQAPIPVNTGALLLEHDALGGGSERTVRIVTDQDVQQVLGAALVGLDNQAREALRAQLGNTNDLVLEESTISPRGNAIPTDESFTLNVTPPVGTTLEANDSSFTVTVGVTYKALATPANMPLQSQLQTVVARQFENQGNFPMGMAPVITSWHWDGSSLTVDGMLQPMNDDGELDAQTRAAILASVKGKSHAEAVAALENFVQQGIISDYTLPDVEQLPRWSFQLSLEVEQASALEN